MNPIKKYLEHNDITVKGFAIKIGVTREYLHLIMSGYRKPSPDLAQRIEKATNGEIKKEWLVFPEEYKEEIEEYLSKQPAGAVK